jgi:tetratricopeptide (TPR) repeat protein
MKKHFAGFAFVLLMLGLSVPPGFAQAGGTVKGVCKDLQGNPIADGIVVWANQDNGQKYTLKTNKKGEYFSLGIVPGKYNLTLYKNADDAKANKELFHMTNLQVAMEEMTQDLNLKQEQAEQAKGAGLTPEQIKQRQELEEKRSKEINTVKALNEKISAANASMKAGDFDSAATTMTEATQMDDTRDVIWVLLGDADRGSALKQTDRDEKLKRMQEAVTAYQKAIDLKQKTMDAAAKKDPEDNKRLAEYYNHLADASAKSGKLDEALKAYTQAAQLNPEGASAYYYNAGAVLTNAGRVDDAIAAFDKCIAADPTKADAYYQKGVNLIGKATLQGEKMVAPPGTAEAFQKYLELQPTGQFADVAKQMLASIGAPVETGFGTKKKAKN